MLVRLHLTYFGLRPISCFIAASTAISARRWSSRSCIVARSLAAIPSIKSRVELARSFRPSYTAPDVVSKKAGLSVALNDSYERVN